MESPNVCPIYIILIKKCSQNSNYNFSFQKLTNEIRSWLENRIGGKRNFILIWKKAKKEEFHLNFIKEEFHIFFSFTFFKGFTFFLIWKKSQKKKSRSNWYSKFLLRKPRRSYSLDLPLPLKSFFKPLLFVFWQNGSSKVLYVERGAKRCGTVM